MRRAFGLLVFSVIAFGQDGKQVFERSCASGYCHGMNGVAGGAPRLAARGFDQAYIANTISRGLPGTAMAAFSGSLSRADLTAVISYVATLNGITNPRVNAPEPAAPLSGEASRARDLFSEAVRGFGRCSTCHEVNGIGIAVAVPIANVPADVTALRRMTTPAVRTATLNGRAMPALSISNGARATIFYDLTTAPPVQHTAEQGAVSWKDGSEWRHSSVIGSYNDAELASILVYLRSAAKP